MTESRTAQIRRRHSARRSRRVTGSAAATFIDDEVAVVVDPVADFLCAGVDERVVVIAVVPAIPVRDVQILIDIGRTRTRPPIIRRNVFVDEGGRRVLGKPIAKTVEAVEALSSQSL